MWQKFLLVACLTLTITACSSAPSKEQVKESIKKIVPVAFEVLDVKAVADIPGLYEVVLRANNQPVVLYTDKKGKYILSGSLMLLETKTNLTLEAQKKYLSK
jgi:DNA-binding protein Fis